MTQRVEPRDSRRDCSLKPSIHLQTNVRTVCAVRAEMNSVVRVFGRSVNRKAEEAVKSARDALEALIGPFRLRSTVNGALKRGMLMPFPVSVQRGKAAAKLERGRKMREASCSTAPRMHSFCVRDSVECINSAHVLVPRKGYFCKGRL